LGRIFRDNTPPAPGPAAITLDRKLLRKLRAKKIAQGHAADEHTQTHTL
jgi:hypothetical protein